MGEIERAWEHLSRELGEATRRDPLSALVALAAVQHDVAAHERAAVRAAVQHHSWAEIGTALGVSKQAAHQRFAKVWADTLKAEITAEHASLRAARRDGAGDRAAQAAARRDAVVAEFKSANRRKR